LLELNDLINELKNFSISFPFKAFGFPSSTAFTSVKILVGAIYNTFFLLLLQPTSAFVLSRRVKNIYLWNFVFLGK